jgi:two-component system, NtrC family, C4-dicarboxylate transport sensor histidine kinase DctB
MWEIIKSGKTWKGIIKNRAKDGSNYWVDTVITSNYNEQHDIIGYTSVRHDVTAQKLLEALQQTLEEKIAIAVQKNEENNHMLAQQNRLASMGEMLGNIAHQWRQPLNALSIIIQKIKLFKDQALLDDNKMQELYDKQMQHIENMSTTIDDFRNFFRPDKTKERFILDTYVHNAGRLLEALFIEHQISVECTIDPNL